jgi:hypothetical protein
MKHIFKSMRDELNFRRRLEFDPNVAFKSKVLAKDLEPSKGSLINPISTVPGSLSQPGQGGEQNLGINDPLKNQIDAEMKFSSYQFNEGMKSLGPNGTEPQTAGELQNQMYAQEQLQNPNSLNQPDPIEQPKFLEPYKNPIQPLFPGKIGPLY